MTIRFHRAAGNELLRVLDTPVLTFPGSESSWCLGWTVVFDGSFSGTEVQYAMGFGTIGTAGSVNIAHHESNVGTNPGRVVIFTTGTSGFPSSRRFESGQWQFVLQKSLATGLLTLRACPVLSALPSDGSAVTQEMSQSLANSKTDVAMDGNSGLYVARRNDAQRKFDNSLARLFRYDGTLTDLEVAQLASGMEITDLGKSPAWYIRMNDVNDITDRGPSALTVTPTGAITTGTAPTYAYDSSNPPSSVPTSISGTPTINGTATVGLGVTYTAAPVSGVPMPATSQQWTLDGVDIAGAIGTTYVPVSGDAGKALRVRQIATNSQGVKAEATSSPVTVAAPAVSTIAVNPMPAERIYQRIGTSATIPISGTYQGSAPTSIDFQLYAEDGTTVLKSWAAVPSPTIANGAWSGIVSIPQGGMYRIAVRDGSRVSNVDTSLFGVGALFGVIGSSSAALLFHVKSGANLTPRSDVRANTTQTWSKFGTDGAAIILANGMAETLGVPVGLLNYGSSGTQLGGWAATNSGLLATFTRAVTSVGGKLEGCYITAGSNDAAGDAISSKEDHLAKMRTLITNIRNFVGQPNLPILWSGSNRRPDNDTRVAQFDMLHWAENVIGDDADVTYVQTMDFDLSDGVHLNDQPNGYPGSIRRTNYQWGERFKTGSYLRGPKIASMVREGNDVLVNLQHRGSTDFTPTTGITGFTSDAVINSVSRVSANQIRVAAASAPATLKYLPGPSPAIGTPVYGNTSTKLPMQVEAYMSLSDAGTVTPDTSAPLMSGTLTFASVTKNSAQVSWANAVDNIGVAGYEISSNGGTSYIDTGTARTYQLSTLSANTLYQVRVRAYDAAGNRSNVISQSFTTLADTPPVTTPMFTRSKMRTIKVRAAPMSYEMGAYWGMDQRRPTGSIDPNSTIDITFDWSDLLADIADTILKVQFDLEGLTNAGAYNDATTATIFVSGAIGNPRITCRITTSSTPARVEDRTVFLKLEQQ